MEVKEKLTLLGGARWEPGTLQLDNQSELRLTSDELQKREYSLKGNLGAPGATIGVNNAVVRGPPHETPLFVGPLLILEEGSQLMNDEPAFDDPNYAQFIKLNEVQWKGGMIGDGDPAQRTE